MKNNTPTSTPAAVAVNANAELVARVAELEAALESIVGLITSPPAMTPVTQLQTVLEFARSALKAANGRTS